MTYYSKQITELPVDVFRKLGSILSKSLLSLFISDNIIKYNLHIFNENDNRSYICYCSGPNINDEQYYNYTLIYVLGLSYVPNSYNGLSLMKDKMYFNGIEYKLYSPEEFKEEYFALSTVLSDYELKILELSTYFYESNTYFDSNIILINTHSLFSVFYRRNKELIDAHEM